MHVSAQSCHNNNMLWSRVRSCVLVPSILNENQQQDRTEMLSALEKHSEKNTQQKARKESKEETMEETSEPQSHADGLTSSWEETFGREKIYKNINHQLSNSTQSLEGTDSAIASLFSSRERINKYTSQRELSTTNVQRN
eukprot:Sdes_comp18354_c0_seq1m8118